MSLSLIDVNIHNLSDYIILEKKDDLSYFMSRTRPYNYEIKSKSTLLWKYIDFQNKRIGALWIEKEKEDSIIATLGIFIADTENQCKGIGSAAIEIAIAQAKEKTHFSQIELHVRDTNIRAIRCYEKCGFREISRFNKDYLNENVVVIIMRRIV